MKLAVHKFNSETDIPFDIKEYSRFKYGCFESTIRIAKSLAHLINLHIISNNLCNREIVICGAPYNQVPVASTALAEYVTMLVNITMNGLDVDVPTIKNFKIDRQHSYHDDYGSMSLEDRGKSISGETFYVEPDSLKGKYVIFIDDIRITGSHEHRIQAMIDKLELDCEYVYAYYAMLENHECCPKIEAILNHAAVNTDSAVLANFLIQCAARKELLLNTRVVKFLLRLDEDTFCIMVLSSLSKSNAMLLAKYATSNGYNKHEYYVTNFNHLIKIIL